MECVYMITNIINNKIYIGSTVDYEKRVRSHINGMDGGYHDNSRIQEDAVKYGSDNFKFRVLYKCDNEEERFKLEEELIQALKTYNHGYNMSVDGRGRYLISNETREKMRQRSLGKNNHFYGKTHTEETKKLIAEKARVRNLGEGNPFYGKTHTEETLRKIQETFNKLKESGWVSPQKGVPKTKEAIYNNMMAQPKRKPVYAEGKVYPSISAAARDIGVVNTTIKNRIKSKNFEDYYYIDK